MGRLFRSRNCSSRTQVRGSIIESEFDIARQIDHAKKNPKKSKGGFKQPKPRRGDAILNKDDLMKIYENQEHYMAVHLVEDCQHRMLDQHKGRPRTARPEWVSRLVTSGELGSVKTLTIITVLLLAVFLIGLFAIPSRADARPAMNSTKATWYGPCCYGGTVACGGKFNENTISLAIATGHARCGARYKICHRGTCATLKVRDFCPGCGGGHLFDLSAGLVRRVFHVAPGSWGTRTVTYRKVA